MHCLKMHVVAASKKHTNRDAGRVGGAEKS